jgi:hypothetical protein
MIALKYDFFNAFVYVMFVFLGLLKITSGRTFLPQPPLTPIHFPESVGGR